MPVRPFDSRHDFRHAPLGTTNGFASYTDGRLQTNFFESFELFARRKRPDLDQNADWVKTDSGTAIVAG
jgi:hypothetical protein